MSLKDKASRINFGALPGMAPSPAPLASDETKRPKTAPGLMMAHAADQRSDLLRENEALKTQVGELAAAGARVLALQEELKAWDGAKAARLIDPALIVPSRWANRHAKHFESAEFQALVAEIQNAGGNVQPVKVRPLPAGDAEPQRYELVYGHRRHAACARLGLPVLAVVDNLDDSALFVEMDRENRARKDLSAWEQGVMYRRALDEGLFPSNRRLADAVGADLSNVGKALALAALPHEVVRAFASPLDLQFRWAKPLREAWEADPASMRERAAELAARAVRPKAKEVFMHLVAPAGQGGGTVPPPSRTEVWVDGQRAAHVRQDGQGRTEVQIDAGWISSVQVEELKMVLEKFLEAARRKKSARRGRA